MKIGTIGICFGVSSTYSTFFKEKYQNLNSLWYFKGLQANCLWADLGSFGQILMHWQ
jgi:hypothetical protein